MRGRQYESLLEAIAALRQEGFTEDFLPQAGGLRARGSGRLYGPQSLRIVEIHRFEGQTDPDEMSVLYALEAQDGTRGPLTDAFGAYADPALGLLLRRIPTAPPLG